MATPVGTHAPHGGAWRLGTRGSALALTQARLVAAALAGAHPGVEVEIVTITTKGDVRTDVPLSAIGGVGVFAAELEAALRAGEVDFAVHSAKDLPSTAPADMALAAFLEREDPRDVLVSGVAGAGTLRALPHGARVGTSSPRRACQLRAARPDLDLRDIRGNVDTRLRKLDAGEYDAIVLAAAGLRRLGLIGRATEHLDPADMLPQVGQGAIAIEVRADDAATAALVALVDHARTRAAVEAERAFLARLGAGCTAPAGAHAALRPDGTLVVEGMVGHADGRGVRRRLAGPVADAKLLGAAVAEALIGEGGDVLLREAGVRSTAAVATTGVDTAGVDRA
ncbi:hydroxymethylbilane synthase [Roseisolibacter sp. H3M3-2]|uniref:hydroxymethylbilane synthase n=1 Tax=Roseisolibacter sp. H3M3-2 TaxID=3031323 RepID=UPI0023DABDC6|nr:hydroxymethylbilane synthase [Roseisolibacter sp. H3M3-2]MDF1502401.1 hydroxymethylbilane synthase [Roseisolibacter sp. H3M3-2]